jgi:hypothetical protein
VRAAFEGESVPSPSVAMAMPISCTLVRWLSRVPSCWIDWSWAAQDAIFSKFWAFLIATDAWVARAAIVSSSSAVQPCGASW